MQRTGLVLIAAALLGAGLTACGSLPPYRVGEENVYTLTNLHFDPANGKLTTVNYQLDGLLPICTPVRFVGQTRKSVIFQVVGKERQYHYFIHSRLAEPFDVHLDKYFGDRCDKSKVARLGPKDRQGIKKGRAFKGMTRKGVIYAIGYPPEHANPDIESDQWIYWRNRFDRFIVEFDGNIVERIRN